MLTTTIRLVIVLFSWSSCLFVNGQQTEVDSLQKLLSGTTNNTTRVDLLNALTKSLFNDNPDTTVIIATSAKTLAGEISYKPGLALALKNIGKGFYLQGQYLDAVKIWQEALEVYKAIGDKTGVA